MSRAYLTLAAQRWAITEEYLEIMADIAERENPIEAIERYQGEPAEGTSGARIRDGVGVVALSGPVFRYANLMTRYSGATSSEVFTRDLVALADNPDVRAIVIDVDSPGGMLNGTAETAEMIRAVSDKKPVYAFISGMGASAAYWMAAGAQKVVIGATAMAGSIGVIHEVQERIAGRAEGQRLVTVSSQSPRKRMDVFSADEQERGEARASLQATIDRLGEEFVSAVARLRGTSFDDVAANFGQGAVFVGEDAVEAGLADAVGTLEDTIISLSQGSTRGAPGVVEYTVSNNTHSATLSIPDNSGGPMGDATHEDAPAVDWSGVTEEDLRANVPSLIDEIEAGARTAERERILDIQALAGDRELIQDCVSDPAVTAGDAAVRVLHAQKSGEEAAAKAHLAASTETEEALDAPGPSAEVSDDRTSNVAAGKSAAALYNSLRTA